MEQVTGEQVRMSMMAKNIKWVDHHDCGGCGSMVGYSCDGESLFFNSGCDCSWSPPRRVLFQEAADFINMQSSPEWRVKLAARFGIELVDDTAKVNADA